MTLALALSPALLGLDCRGLLNSPLVGTGDVDEAAFHARQLSYLRYAAQQGSSPGSVLNLINHLERSRVDPPYAPSFVVPVDAYDGILLKFSRFEDTSDFDMLYLLNLWLGYGSDPILPAGLLDNAYYWSENHQIIFHTLEYLAGQSFPDRVFGNDGLTGREKQAHARALILEWIDCRARFGFNEWHSDVYYQKLVTPLLTLAKRVSAVGLTAASSPARHHGGVRPENPARSRALREAG
jgi:hypothetical protein